MVYLKVFPFIRQHFDKIAEKLYPLIKPLIRQIHVLHRLVACYFCRLNCLFSYPMTLIGWIALILGGLKYHNGESVGEIYRNE